MLTPYILDENCIYYATHKLPRLVFNVFEIICCAYKIPCFKNIYCLYTSLLNLTIILRYSHM